MANGKDSKPPAAPMAYNDFFKTNGSDTTILPHGDSLTRQEFAEECDINVLMKRYDQAGTGVNFMPRDPRYVPQYVDFSAVPSTLMEFMDLMQAADAAFMTLPAVVRKEFDNDPMQFVEYAYDPANLEQMRSWGLAPPAKAPETAPGAPSPGPSDGTSPGAAAPGEAPKPAAPAPGSTPST